MKERTLYKIEDLLCEELESVAEKEHIGSISDLQTLDTVLHATKNLYKIMGDMEGGSSYGMNGGNSSYYSRRGSSYRGDSSYDDGGFYRYSRDNGGSYRRGRDRMGRFVSRSSGDMVDRLKDMMHETDDPEEKQELDKFIKGIEHRG